MESSKQTSEEDDDRMDDSVTMEDDEPSPIPSTLPGDRPAHPCGRRPKSSRTSRSEGRPGVIALAEACASTRRFFCRAITQCATSGAWAPYDSKKTVTMDFILDQYIFNYLPFNVSADTRKSITDKAMSLVVSADWWCKVQDPHKIIENHTSFFFCEVVFIFCCFLTFIHAWRKGGRYWYVWLGILIHSLNVENLCYWIPDLDNFWQAQGVFTFFGMRAPLYIILGIYHMFDYTAYVFVRRMRLPWWAEGPAVGLGAVMLDMPYDILGIKQLWWTWHDTDPNIYDRMYWVPWNSYYFHASFACSFVWILTFTRKFLLPREYDWKLFVREFLCAFLAGTGAFWLGTLQFGVLYHPMHDYLKVHTELTTVVFLSTYAIIVYTADRHNKSPLARPGPGGRWWFDELALAVCIEYIFMMVLVLVADPVNIVAEGLHQPIGPCDEKQKVLTPSGMVLSKGKYLCPTRYDEKMYDFHCLPEGRPPQMQQGEPIEWYAICGTKFDNRAEYIFIIWSICLLFGAILFQWASRSGETPLDPIKVYRVRTSAIYKEHTTPVYDRQGEVDSYEYESSIRRRAAVAPNTPPQQLPQPPSPRKSGTKKGKASKYE